MFLTSNYHLVYWFSIKVIRFISTSIQFVASEPPKMWLKNFAFLQNIYFNRGDTAYHGTYTEVWPSPYTVTGIIILATCLYYVFCESMNFHPDKQLSPSCRHQGLNHWPLNYNTSALPLHHGGPTMKYFYFHFLCVIKIGELLTTVSSSINKTLENAPQKNKGASKNYLKNQKKRL